MYAIVSLVLVALLAGTTEANPIDFPPLGGWSEIGTNDQDVQEAAAFAASELNLNLVDVISAQSQVRFSLFYHRSLKFCLYIAFIASKPKSHNVVS